MSERGESLKEHGSERGFVCTRFELQILVSHYAGEATDKAAERRQFIEETLRKSPTAEARAEWQRAAQRSSALGLTHSEIAQQPALPGFAEESAGLGPFPVSIGLFGVVPGVNDETARLVSTFVPTAYELEVLARYYLEALNSIVFEDHYEGYGSSYGDRFAPFANRRLNTIFEALGEEAFECAVAHTRREFEKVCQDVEARLAKPCVKCRRSLVFQDFGRPGRPGGEYHDDGLCLDCFTKADARERTAACRAEIAPDLPPSDTWTRIATMILNRWLDPESKKIAMALNLLGELAIDATKNTEAWKDWTNLLNCHPRGDGHYDADDTARIQQAATIVDAWLASEDTRPAA